MHVIRASNVNTALVLGLRHLIERGAEHDTRAGVALTAPEPVTTMYERPRERVLLAPWRDANPFLHLYESLWMLAGRRDVAPLQRIVKRFASFSDDGTTLRDAYGHRWRRHFGYDQLQHVIGELRSNPKSRRVVLQMWDAREDLGRHSSVRAVPCNLLATFRVRQGDLDMSVHCRSNDALWGAYGANAVHFSILQEYVAAAIGAGVGAYWQVSDDFHAYRGALDDALERGGAAALTPLDPYRGDTDMRVIPLMRGDEKDSAVRFDAALFIWMASVDAAVSAPWSQDSWQNARLARGYPHEPILHDVAGPLLGAHDAWLRSPGGPEERYERARAHLEVHATPCDWTLAAAEWFERRISARRRAADDGPHPGAGGGEP